MLRDRSQPKAGRPGPKGQAVKAAARGGGSLVEAARAPTVSLPKGGGAFKGIGEKFSANPVTGTGSMTVPLATSPGRAGFGPQLSLSYDSGAGNGPFGFGWSLSLPSITRKTDKGLPQYHDADESDVFILSGAEDLVPALSESGGEWAAEELPPRALEGESFNVRRYRPRVEGQFARIECWTNQQTGDSHWRTISPDNVTTLYGKDDSCRVFDPDSAAPGRTRRVFSWLVCESYDDKGNAILFRYAAEDDANVDRMLLGERNRRVGANRYPKSIKYGNRTSRLLQPDLTQTEWMFEVVFDYDEAHYQEVGLDPDLAEDEQHRFVRASLSPGAAWPVRPDAFSEYRPGFEVRSYRRCRRVLMFHRFDELGGEPYLVRSTEFDYRDLDYTQPRDAQTELAHEGSTRLASFIQAVNQSGYVRDETQPALDLDGARYFTYLKKSLPPLEFAYSKANIREEVGELDSESLENLPVGIDGAVYQWVDLDGEGISGILTDQGDGWFYKRGLGGGRFGPLEVVASKPSLAELGGGPQKLLDLTGDGRLELVSFSGPAPGFYERTQDADWEPFKAFPSLPRVPWDRPGLRFIDLNGDGRADILMTEDEVFTWYPSLAEEGFESARYVRQALDEERGPRLLLADDAQSIYLADMCGDGLTDLVRVSNGEVCYWPNLGYGRFGAKVSMDNAPRFDNPDQFDQRRVRLADIDGSGTSDLIYLGREAVDLYFNQSGGRWSDARRLTQFPPVDNLSSVTTADLLGNGTACLVWSSPLPADARRQLRYLDLMGGQKPHLLVRVRNNMGSETVVNYVSSTSFYLGDKAAGRPWFTKLPFPVHVVERAETLDQISGNRFVTRYAYHHGYFDGLEREFRGFGMVEQWDTEGFAALDENQEPPAGANFEETSHVPPVLTRTWFHTGAYLDRRQISELFAGSADGRLAGEYYREPALTAAQARDLLLPDTLLPAGLLLGEEIESCRVLKGMMLRQEVYALDGSELEPHPFSVSEQNFTVRMLQPRGPNRHAVFFTRPREGLFYHYERDPTDPRISHTFTLELDEYGNVLKEASVGYGRRQTVRVINEQGEPEEVANPALEQLSQADRDTQTATLITYTEKLLTNPVNGDDDYRAPLFAEARTYQLTGLDLAPGQSRFTPDEILDAVTGAEPLDYEEETTAGTQEKRLIEQSRTLYRADDLSGALTLGEVESRALLFESYKLALTPGMVATRFGGRVTDAMLELEGRYVHSGDANWWVPLGRVFYSPVVADTPAEELAHAREHFFLPRRYRDPFHTDALSTETLVTYDAHDLLVVETRDPFGNRVTAGERDAGGELVAAGNDYRVLQPRLIMDANRNRAAAGFDALGAAVGTALMGKPEENPPRGDLLDSDFRADLTQAEVNQYFADPQGPVAAALLAGAGTRVVYDLTTFWREPEAEEKQPVFAATLARETHAADSLPEGGLRIQHSFAYADGFGREIQQKLMAEAGPAPLRDAAGKIIVGPDGQPQLTPGNVAPRWVGSGWTVFNNKGKPVRQYEPYFTDTHRFEFDVRIGVSPVIFYDALERVAGILHPNHTWEKTVFDPWQQASWDVNDTVLVSDPTTDPEVGDFFRRQPEPNYLPTWFEAREGGALGPQEQAAAAKAAVHAATPAVAHSDSLGRTVRTVAHNKFKYSDTPPDDPPASELLTARVVYDIEGNQLQVGDAEGRLVMLYEYDLLGGRLHQSSMEAGERWTLNDVTGKALYAWDGQGRRFRNTYDALRRPADSFVSEGGGAERLVGRIVYGEGEPGAEAANLRGHVARVLDQAGVVTTGRYDFKGNALSSTRQLAEAYSTTLDWASAVPLSADSYTRSTAYDALNRPTEITSPDNTVVRPAYNEANLLESLEAHLRGAAVATRFVTGIGYDAKGQRTTITYGNGVRTAYEYDRLTYRLTRLRTMRDAGLFPGDCPQPSPPGWPGCQVQDLHYTYDPAGNLTGIRDDAQQTVYFRNRRVEPSSQYTYDALYRLIEATGREHLGQAAGAPTPHSYNDAPRLNILLSTSDGNAMGRYLERYVYDGVGNLLELAHRGSDPVHPGWTRAYSYAEESLLEPGRVSNRLTSTTVGAQTESYSAGGNGYDAHGNMLRMPQLQIMRWDFENQLRMTRRQAVNVDDDEGAARQGERTWYVYDHEGQRVRKVTEFAGGQIREERIYVGGFEIYRRHGASPLERETLHIMDDKRRLALVETRTEGNEPGVPQQLIRYQYGNHLGSTSLELDGQAQIISYEEYTPYGSTSYQAVRSQTGVPRRYRFTGKERDEESGLYYHGARYYAPWLARWTAADPAELLDGPNLYAYARNRPTTVTDPDGTQGLNLSEQSVLNVVDSMLTKKGVAYSTEVTVKVTLPNGTVVVRRYDRFYMDPDTKRWVGVEAKGSQINKLTASQEIADKWVQEKGGKFEVVKGATKPPGTAKVTGVPMQPGFKGDIDPGNLQYVHGKSGNPTPKPGKPSMMHIDTWKQGISQKLQNATPPPNSVLKTAPNAPPSYVPRQGVVDDYKKNTKPKQSVDLDDPKNRPAKPPGKAQPSGQPSGKLSGKLAGGAKAVAPMAVTMGLNYFRLKNYNEAAQLREQYSGPVTDEMIERQERAGWKFTGEYDQEGRPKWEYDPGGALLLREMLFFIMDPTEGPGDPHSQPKCTGHCA